MTLNRRLIGLLAASLLVSGALGAPGGRSLLQGDFGTTRGDHSCASGPASFQFRCVASGRENGGTSGQTFCGRLCGGTADKNGTSLDTGIGQDVLPGRSADAPSAAANVTTPTVDPLLSTGLSGNSFVGRRRALLQRSGGSSLGGGSSSLGGGGGLIGGGGTLGGTSLGAGSITYRGCTPCTDPKQTCQTLTGAGGAGTIWHIAVAAYFDGPACSNAG